VSTSPDLKISAPQQSAFPCPYRRHYTASPFFLAKFSQKPYIAGFILSTTRDKNEAKKVIVHPCNKKTCDALLNMVNLDY